MPLLKLIGSDFVSKILQKSFWMKIFMYLLELTLSDDVEHSRCIIKSAILHTGTLFIPKLKVKPNNLPKYFTSNIKHQLNKKEKIEIPYWSQHKPFTELCLSRDIAHANSNYESKLIQDFACHNKPRIYCYIRNLRKSDALPPSVLYNDTIATDDFAKASLFNKFFYSVFTTSNVNTPSDDDVLDTSATNHIISIDTSEDEVFNALTTLDPNKATEIDGIGPKILKIVQQHFSNLFITYTH